MRKLKILSALVLTIIIAGGLLWKISIPQQEDTKSAAVDKIVIGMEKTTEILDDLDMVVDEINEYIRPLISAEIELLYIDSSTYDRTLNYKFSADEQMDIIFQPAISGVEGLRRRGKLLPLDDLIKEYGQGILENLKQEEMVLGRIGGQLYGITTNRNKGYVFGVQYRKDIADKYGIDVSEIKEMKDLTPVFQKLKEENPDAVPVITSSYSRTWDTLSVDYCPLGVLMDYGQSAKVVDLYKTKEYEDYVRLLYEWNQAGYMADTSLAGTDDYHSLFRSDNAFCHFDTDSPEMAERESRVLGVPVGYLAFSPVFTSSIDLTYAFWTISSSCEKPEKAMQILNLMYSDRKVANLLLNGIEGVHYRYVDKNNGIIGFPEGVDSSTSRYTQSNGWKLGNQFLADIWEGNSPKLWDEIREYNQNSLKSQAFGFLFDSNKVSKEYQKCIEIKNKYAVGLEEGRLNPDVYLPKLQQELAAAGLDSVIAEKQRQLDAWLAREQVGKARD